MVEARVARRAGVPWTVRLFEVSLAPAWIGLLIAALWWSLYLAYGYAGGWGAGSLGEFWSDLQFEILWAVMIGYVPTATSYSLRAAVRDLQILRPVLRCSEAEFQDRLGELTRFDGRQLLAISIVAIACGIALPFAPGYWVEGRPPLGHPALTWNWVRNVVLNWLIWRTLYIEIVTAARFSRIGSRWAQIDLLELGSLAPFSRRGLGSVLLLMGLAILFSFLFTAPWETDYLTVGSLIGFLAVAATALLLPVLGVHRRIREVKSKTLERIRAEIRNQGDPTLQPRADSRLPDLIAYKGLIESVPTWPFDLSTLLRFSFYVAVGLGSWLGGAFVERLVDSVLS